MAGKRTWLGSLPAESGLVGVLVLVCGAFSFATLTEERPEGAAAGEALARKVARDRPASVLIVAGTGRDDRAFADAVESELQAAGVIRVTKVVGTPADAKEAIDVMFSGSTVVVASRTAERWAVWRRIADLTPVTPQSRVWPRFL